MKNFSIITLIFVLPLIAYFALARPDVSMAAKKVSDANKPQIIKFTSLMCLDCKKLDKVFKEVYPKYSDKITLVEVPVQSETEYTKAQIEKYNVTLVPTMVFLNAKGQKQLKTEGFVEKAQLQKYMKDLTHE